MSNKIEYLVVSKDIQVRVKITHNPTVSLIEIISDNPGNSKKKKKAVSQKTKPN